MPRDAQLACWPRFPYRDGWLGGDGAYSIPLSDGGSLWLFGDTFVGRSGQTDRVGAKLVHNSVGVSECTVEGGFRIEYFWSRAPDGSPRALLERPQEGWWWLQGGFAHGGHLYLALLEVEEAPPRGPLGLPVRFTGTALARIDDASEDPRRWRVERFPLSRSDEVFPIASLVVDGSYLYLFAFVDRGDGRAPRILARLPVASLAAGRDLEAAIETLGRDGRWRLGLALEHARVLMEDSATEMSVRFDPAIGKWLALYSHPDLAGSFPDTRPSDAVYVRTADALAGPWSERRLVFRIPELAPDRDPPPDPNTGCYAAKEQPQFSRPGSMTFTYVCNLFAGPGEEPFAVLRRLQGQMELYRPAAATVTLP